MLSNVKKYLKKFVRLLPSAGHHSMLLVYCVAAVYFALILAFVLGWGWNWYREAKSNLPILIKVTSKNSR